MTNNNDDIARQLSGLREFISEHPDVLANDAELMSMLNVPHECGGVVSLVEHQVAVLKDDNKRLRRKLRELVDNATRNQERVQRLLDLSLDLLECSRLSDVAIKLYSALRDDFDVDVARVRLFGETNATSGGLVFVSRESQAHVLFESLLRTGEPVCGRLKSSQLQFLFGDQVSSIGSSALLPLGPAGSLGLLAIGSHDPQRFHPAQGTEFLRKLGGLVTRAVATHLHRESGHAVIAEKVDMRTTAT